MRKGKFQKGYIRCTACLKWLHPRKKRYGADEIVLDSAGRPYHSSRFCAVETTNKSARLRHKSKYRLGRK